LNGALVTPSITIPRFDVYDEEGYQGTSKATPHVASTAALIMSQLGSAATPALVEAIIKATTRPCSATSCDASVSVTRGRTDSFGYWLIQPRTALFGVGLAK
jgi:subtilisin family serine protease